MRQLVAAVGLILALVCNGANAAVLQDLSYTRDAAGRILEVTSSVTGESWTYGYDDLYRLTSATNADTPALTQSWTYDSVGNMTSNSSQACVTAAAGCGSGRRFVLTFPGLLRGWLGDLDSNQG